MRLDRAGPGRARRLAAGLAVVAAAWLAGAVRGEGVREEAPRPAGEYEVPVDIRGKRVEYRGHEGRAVFSGGVRVVRGPSVLTSDELETIRGANEAVARGHVVFKDAERNLDLTCDELVYTHGLKQVRATGNCHLVAGKSDEVTVVTSDEMEMFVDSREAVAGGDVRIVQGVNEAACAKAHLFGQEERVVLTGRPVLRRPPHEFECDEAVTYFKEGRTVLTGAVKGRLHADRIEELKGEEGAR